MTQMYFSQFWKLQVQEQGIIKAGFILGLLWVYRWLLSHCVFIWSLNVHLEKGGVFWCLLQVLHSHDLIKPSYLSKAPPPSPSRWWLEFPHMNLGGDKMFIPSGQSSPIGQREDFKTTLKSFSQAAVLLEDFFAFWHKMYQGHLVLSLSETWNQEFSKDLCFYFMGSGI